MSKLVRYLLLITVAFLFKQNSFCQDKAPVTFGKVKVEDFAVRSALIDSNTTAVGIYDKCDISFEGNESGWFRYVFKRSKRMLIINRNGIDNATVELLLYRNEDSREKLENLAGVTYNLAGGSVNQTSLNEKDVFEEKTDKNHFSNKFTMPAVKDGSIIEYSYTIKSDFTFNLPSWDFQSASYPVLWSECNVAIPGLLSYMTFKQGYHQYTFDIGSEKFKNYSIRRMSSTNSVIGDRQESLNLSSPVTVHRWVMKDLPKLYVENYVTALSNYIDKISFQLYKTYDGQDYHDVANSWGKVSEELMKREDFGQPVTAANSWLDPVLKTVVSENDVMLDKARKIYYYLQKNFTCTNSYNKYIKTTLQDVMKKKSGSVGDINLLLITMLNHININAVPVLLSTRDFGRNTDNFPQMERLNYVVAKFIYDTISVYLDATIPFLPFGKLPLKCFNGHARAIGNDTTAVYFTPESAKEVKTTTVFISNNDKQDVEGTFSKKLGFFESLDTKSEIAKTSIQAYKTKFTGSFPEEMEFSNFEIDSLYRQDDPLETTFDFKLNLFKNADIVYFSPLFGEASLKNPFYAAERIYPVEMPYLLDDTYILNMDLPAGYKVDELPKSVKIKLNEDDGVFEYLISADKTLVQMRCRLQMKKAFFPGEDYQTLRDFYAFIVKKKAEQIVFKKIK